MIALLSLVTFSLFQRMTKLLHSVFCSSHGYFQQISAAIERIVTGLEGVILTDSRNKRLVAYHEVGHALAGTLLKNHDDVQKVTLIPRGRAQGLTWFTPEEQPLMTRGQLSSRLIGTLAGRAAEKVIFGKMDGVYVTYVADVEKRPGHVITLLWSFKLLFLVFDVVQMFPAGARLLLSHWKLYRLK